MTEDEVIATQDPCKIYVYAKENPTANIARLQEAIIQTGDMYYIEVFGEEIEGAHIPTLQAAVCSSNSCEAIFWFAVAIPEADKEQLGEAMRKTNNSFYIELFLKFDISESLKEKLKKKLVLSRLMKGGLYDF